MMRKILLTGLVLFTVNFSCLFLIRELFQWQPIAGLISLLVYFLGMIYFPYEKLKKDFDK